MLCGCVCFLYTLVKNFGAFKFPLMFLLILPKSMCACKEGTGQNNATSPLQVKIKG